MIATVPESPTWPGSPLAAASRLRRTEVSGEATDHRLRLRSAEFAGIGPERLADDPVRLHRWLLAEAVRLGASDVHADLHEGETRLRFALDGVAVEILRLPPERLENLAARFKTDARLTLGGREPQGGSFSFSVDGQPWDARVQVLHHRLEEPRLIVRLLERAAARRRLCDLGLLEAEQEALRLATARRDGLVLLAGPTGAGKSTTLFALLHELNTPDRVVYTLEDPPEYHLPGATQLACCSVVNEATPARPSFAHGLRSLLRADPDIILVGEIRDGPTAAAAVEAALTGHLILSTLHAQHAVGTVARLGRLGVEAGLLGETLRLAAAQRLVRRVCTCGTRRPPSIAEAALLAAHGLPVAGTVPEAGACARCHRQGYAGRLPVLETLPINGELAEALLADRPEWRRLALAAGHRPLLGAALARVTAGLTTFSELRRQLGDPALLALPADDCPIVGHADTPPA